MTKIYTKNSWQDEVLAGAERYNIHENDGTPIEENVQIALQTTIVQAGSPVSAERMNNIENGLDALDTKVSGIEEGGGANFGAARARTLSSGAFAVDGSGLYLLTGEGGGASSDNLEGITGGVDGMMIVIARAPGAGNILILHNAPGGNIWTAAGNNYYLNENQDGAIGFYNAASGKWWFVTPYELTSDATWAAKGDLMVGGGLRSAGRVAIGANGQKLIADSAQSRGVAWVNDRRLLTSDLTYYVSPTGNDSNDGLTSGTAFATIQKAIDVAAALDMSIYDVTIQVGNGTYSVPAGVVLKQCIGAGSVYIVGDTTTPSNVVISAPNGKYSFSATSVSTIYHLRGMRLTTTTTGGILANRSIVYYQNIDFAVGGYHIRPTNGGLIENTGPYTISAGAVAHVYASKGGLGVLVNSTVTLVGTPAFSGAFAMADNTGVITASSAMTFSGAGSGTRYNANTNGVINTGGGGANFFPGNVAGVTATGGQYA